MNTLQISVENRMIVSRLNGLGEGYKIGGFVSEDQVKAIVAAHNKCEQTNPTRTNATAIYTA
jgi:hypothetical protein